MSNNILLLNDANQKLNIREENKILVFIYSAPKVGSTSLVSSLRLFGSHKIDVIHIHDEVMLQVLGNISGVTVNEIIKYNKSLGKQIYVINVYRTPIERKISTFFEKIDTYHFNDTAEHVNTYDVAKVIRRFNNVFWHIGVGDHFLDVYDIPNLSEHFNREAKYLLVCQDDITYISLRLTDSTTEWNRILTDIFGFKICVIRDYESINKPIKDLYNTFKETYRIPENYLKRLMNDKYLNFYYDVNEINDYVQLWEQKTAPILEPDGYLLVEYEFYNRLCLENCHQEIIQLNHYFDEGCVCKACNAKRQKTVSKIFRIGANELTQNDRISHNSATIELAEAKMNIVINNNNKQIFKNGRKNFRKDMVDIVSKKLW